MADGITIFVDADACPVKAEVIKVAERYQVPVHMVSNSGMRLPHGHPLLSQTVVPDGPDVADDWIADHVGVGDIVVTADIPLAHRCLEKQAAPLGPTGKPFTADAIGMAMAMRDLKAHLRETGEMTGGAPPFSQKDRSRFLSALDQAVQKARRR